MPPTLWKCTTLLAHRIALDRRIHLPFGVLLMFTNWQKCHRIYRVTKDSECFANLQRGRHIVFGWRVRCCNKSMSPSLSPSLCVFLSSSRCSPVTHFSVTLPISLPPFISLFLAIIFWYRATNSLKSRATALYLFPNKLNETHWFALVSINFLLLRSFIHFVPSSIFSERTLSRLGYFAWFA